MTKRLALVLLSACWLMSACARRSEPSTAAEPPPAPPPPTSLDAARGDTETGGLEDPAKRFEQAERELELALGSSEGDASAQAPAPAEEAESSAGVSKSTRGRADRCTTACRALGSMLRSAERLCELSPEPDGRCRDVRDRSERARARVAEACPGCAEARTEPDAP